MSASDPAGDDFSGPRPYPKYLKSEALGKRITEYSAWLNAGEYQLLVMIAEFDREGLWQLDGIGSCAHWLNWQCGIGMNAAREKVRVANALADLPKVSETYRKGEISYSKVRAISRIAAPETEEYLLMIARHGTASHVEGLVSRYRRCRRLQDQKNSVKQHALRELSYFYDEEGSFNLRGRFPAEQGAMILKALELAMERVDAEVEAERQHAEEHWDEEKPWVAANDVDEPCLRYHSDPSGETRPCESFSTRRADALSQLAESYLAHGPKATSTADRYQVLVHVSAETLKKEAADVSAETQKDAPVGTRHAGDPPPADPDVSAETPDLFNPGFSYLEDGPHIAAETARRLSCDASKIEVTDDVQGEPLNIGRKSRIIPPGMRRALRMRDDGCRFPGCTHKHFIDGHHIEHWADGGETSMNNLVQLCRHHHRLVHEHGFGCERMDDGELRFTNSLGNEIGRSGELPRVAENADPRKWLREEMDDLEIDSETGVTRWRGERIDWPLAVGHLFDKQGL